MNAPTRLPSKPVPDQAAAQVLGRMCVAFLLDVTRLARGDRDVIDMLLLSTISQANVSQITARADLQAEYAATDNVPPDDLRRPISANALSSSLGMSYETVRRRAHALVARGQCVWVEGALIVPAAALSSVEYLKGGLAAYERVRRFYYELAEAGLLSPLPLPARDLHACVPLRAVARLTTDYVLRVVEALLQRLPDVVDALVLLEVLRANVEHLKPDLSGRPGLDPAQPPPDWLRRPVTLQELGRRLGLPAETIRRRAIALSATGYLERRPTGLVLPSSVLSRPELRTALSNNAANVQRLMSRLSELGVLSLWDESKGT